MAVGEAKRLHQVLLSLKARGSSVPKGIQGMRLPASRCALLQ